mgnify:CR=1 FL=1
MLIGYPIWWGIAAWPVDTFVKTNDFSDKTVIPFCTSASSGLGESGTRLQKETKGGKGIVLVLHQQKIQLKNGPKVYNKSLCLGISFFRFT